MAYCDRKNGRFPLAGQRQIKEEENIMTLCSHLHPCILCSFSLSLCNSGFKYFFSTNPSKLLLRSDLISLCPRIRYWFTFLSVRWIIYAIVFYPLTEYYAIPINYVFNNKYKNASTKHLGNELLCGLYAKRERNNGITVTHHVFLRAELIISPRMSV